MEIIAYNSFMQNYCIFTQTISKKENMKKNTSKSRQVEINAPVPTLLQIQTELSLKFGAIAVLANEMFMPKSGNRMLGLPDEDGLIKVYDRIDVGKTFIGKLLPVYYAYAYEGRILPGQEKNLDPFGSNEVELLRDFVDMFGGSSHSEYFELAELAVNSNREADAYGLTDMMERIMARHYLDNHFPMSIKGIALLANLNERTVKNATSSKAAGKNQLPLNENGEVNASDAQRWLMARAGRGFIPTTRTEFPEQGKESNVQLIGIEIPAFIKHRILERFTNDQWGEIEIEIASNQKFDESMPLESQLLDRVVEVSGLTKDEIKKAMQYPLGIAPHTCSGLAKAIGVDPTWFTLQVMQALYPNEMDMVLNPQNYRPPTNQDSSPLSALEVTLTEAMIKHGYIDIPSIAKSMFPSDCIQEDGAPSMQKLITIRYGMNQSTETDICVKSEKTISPRKRFTSWLQTENAAKPGDRVRIERIAESEYQLRFQAILTITTKEH